VSDRPVSGRLVATYLAELPADRARAAAEAFATGQSIGTWLPVPGITAEMRRRYGAVVEDVLAHPSPADVAGEPVGDRWLMRVRFPVVNFGTEFPMLLTTLVGNDPSTSLTARLVDIEAPASWASAFPGPRQGVAGWRRITGVRGRPLLLNMIKPCTGFTPEVGAGLAEQVARGGVDLIKDDELLADTGFSPVARRARAYADRLDVVAAETGHRARYIANVTTRPSRLVDTARAALDGGADAVMVNGLATGLDGVRALAEADLGAPILVHTTTSEVLTGGTGSGIGQAVLFGKLLRLAGADGVFTSTPHGHRPLAAEVFGTTVDWLLERRGGRKPVMPMLAGGVTADHIAPLIARAGIDVMLGIGGAIQGHPDGATVGARAMRAAIEAAMAASRGGQP
jgi:2,3-diketo-5-methylthiopentyl-1-phosphate enolase